MRPGTLVLLHSPLTGTAAWGALPGALRAAGYATLVPEMAADTGPPYAQRYVMEAAAALNTAGPEAPVVLVGHSGAGPLLPQVGFAQRSARRQVGGYVFLDAMLPRPAGPDGPPTRLALLHDEDDALAHDLDHDLRDGGTFPAWTDDDLADEVPDDEARHALLASLRPRGRDFFTETLPFPGDWPDAPCAYLRTSAAYDVHARTAQHRGWPVHERGGGHFAALTDPDGLARDLVALVDRRGSAARLA
jgi:hypothetical protein